MASFVENVNKVAALIPAEVVDLGVVADSIDNINLLAPAIADLQSIVDDVVPNIAEILLADDNAQTATTQAGIASSGASLASSSAGTATTQAGLAFTSASNASASEIKASKWADEAEDVEVETGKFSAKHWAEKAADLVTDGIIDDITPSLTKVYSSSKVNSYLSAKAPIASPTFTGTVGGITATMVGLGSVDNTADSAKEVLSATKLTTARTINGVSFDGSSNIIVEGRIGTIASDTTTTIGTVGLPETTHISGTTTITSLGSCVAGVTRTVIFDDVLTLTHNATSLILPDGANITTTAGDSAEFVCDTTNNWKLLRYTRALNQTVNNTSSVRQTVLSGTVDSNGYSAFGGSTGSTTVTSTSTLVATCADGTNDRIGTIVNPSWTGLSTNGTMYLYLNIATNGTCTTGSTTLAPTYRWGGADVITNLQNTFNIQEMKMKVGNGSTASQVYRVFVGEVTVAGSVVTAITWYALRGRYESEVVTVSLNTVYNFNNNIGVNNIKAISYAYCKIAEYGYAVGDRVYNADDGNFGTGANRGGLLLVTNKNTTSITVGNSVGTVNKTTGLGLAGGFTLANWGIGIMVERGW